jgi:hypothetical protein
LDEIARAKIRDPRGVAATARARDSFRRRDRACRQDRASCDIAEMNPYTALVFQISR